MDFELEQQLVSELKKYVTENFSLSKMSDEELEEKIEEIVIQRLGNQYCSIDQRVSIVQQIYSSIRGFGLLDSIMNDDTITHQIGRRKTTANSTRTAYFMTFEAEILVPMAQSFDFTNLNSTKTTMRIISSSIMTIALPTPLSA